MKKIAIIGSGAMATAMAKVLYDANHKDIVIYGVDQKELNDLSQGQNLKYFSKEIKIPKFQTTNNLKETLDQVNYVVLAVPSKVIDVVSTSVIENLSSKTLIINVSKGFYPKKNISIHKGLIDLTKENKFVRGIVSLIGPSHAEEIVKEIPTTVSAVDYDVNLCKEIQNLFSNEYFRVYGQNDVKGAEAAAAYKNVLAIATGIAKGLGFGINTIAAIITRGLVELKTFVKFIGGDVETIYGLTGIGDLIVTATSNYSRNFTFGQNFAKLGQEALNTNATVEGLTALKVISVIAKENNLSLPILLFLDKLLSGEKKILDFKSEIWERSLKFE